MKKLNLAVIGQGRSGKDIHGAYYASEDNKYYNVKYVVEADEDRRKVAKELFPDCETLEDYTELFDKKDVDIVVNASYSEMHYPVTKDLLEHKFNVMVEKPFARTRFECDDLIKTAKDNGVFLTVFQQSFYAPFYKNVLDLLENGQYGKIEQISIRYNGFARRWDWQTLQKKVAGNAYNTGPHPFGIALGFLDFSENTQVVFSKLACTTLNSGDSDDYCKVIMTAPDKPVIDLEINSTDAYCDYNVKLQGSKGTFKCTIAKWKGKYIVDGENPERPVQETFLHNGNKVPMYCSEKLVFHEEEGVYEGTSFKYATAKLYEDLYFALSEGREMYVTAEKAADVISVIETLHATNPLERKF